MGLRGDLIKLAHAQPELRSHLVPLLKQGAKTLKSVKSKDIGEAYDKLNPDEVKREKDWVEKNGFPAAKVKELRQERDDTLWRKAEKIIKTVKDDDEVAFKKEASLSKTNFYGKVTRALMAAVGIKKAKNLADLFQQMNTHL